MAYRPRIHRRRPHHFRFRPRGFSDPFYGPIWRWLLTLFGIRPQDRRQVYNLLALVLVLPIAVMYATLACLTAGIGNGLGALIAGLIIGWLTISLLRYFR